jgi:hypothetical protein
MCSIHTGHLDFEGQGTLRVEVISLPYMHSHCGFVEEKNTTMSMRKWWAVLAEGRLLLFKHYGKMNPDQTINLKLGTGAAIIKRVGMHTKYRHGQFCELNFKQAIFRYVHKQ